MKVNTPKNSPIAVLYTAAKEIVDSTRGVFAKQGKDARELRLPILMHGTDMRVTIEAGPQVAARNAIEEAQMKVTGKPVEPSVDMTRALYEAKALLATDAASLRAAHTINGEWPETEADAKASYDRYIAAIHGLKEVERLL